MTYPDIARRRQGRQHELKCWPEFFREIRVGMKRFELRRNDRNFQVGDVLYLREWDPSTSKYSGHECLVDVMYIIDDSTPCAVSDMGLQPGFCIMSIGRPFLYTTRTFDELS